MSRKNRQRNRTRRTRRVRRGNNAVSPRNGMFTVGHTNNPLQSQRITFSVIYSPRVNQNSPDDPIRGYLPIDPIRSLLDSPYRQFREMFAKMRVRKYSVSLWIPRVSCMVPGAMASLLARDSVFFTRDTAVCPGAPNPSNVYNYQQLLLLPGVKHSRLHLVHTHNWRPIEPVDRSWFNTGNSACQSAKDEITPDFGLLTFGAALDNINTIVSPDFQPLCKITFDVDFAYLVGELSDGPTVPRVVPPGPEVTFEQ